MIHRKDISFPITGDSLIAASRLENGREMTEAEKEFLYEVAKTANEAYEAACHGDTDTIQSILPPSMPLLPKFRTLITRLHTFTHG